MTTPFRSESQGSTPSNKDGNKSVSQALVHVRKIRGADVSNRSLRVSKRVSMAQFFSSFLILQVLQIASSLKKQYSTATFAAERGNKLPAHIETFSRAVLLF